jgi:hypothetical protein
MWFTDDSSGIGGLFKILNWATKAKTSGPKYGYHVNSSKSVVVVEKGTERRVEQILASTVFKGAKVQLGAVFLGGHVGDKGKATQYVQSKVETLSAGLQKLCDMGRESPQ